MKIRSVVVALGAAGALLAAGAAPAFASGPPVPAGCSFDQAAGVLTCTTSSTTTSTIGPLTTNGAFVPLSTNFDGVTGQQIVDAVLPIGCADIAITPGTTLSVRATTTTTTERHGLNGKIFATPTSTSLAVLGFAPHSLGGVSCYV